MANQSPVCAFENVVREESTDIRQRRRVAGLPAEQVDENLVGVACSGGGLRSAAFNMGFMQALNATGMWRCIDYLSTVSGGGYLGAFLSSSALQHERPFTRETFPLAEEPGHRQPPNVLKFIYGGGFLLNAWELANKYLIGLVLINVAIFSAVVAASAFIALVWRSFDSNWFRNRAGMFDLSADLLAAFWPFAIFAVMWLLAWVLSYYRRGAVAPGRMARYLLHATAFSFIVGVAMLLGNGTIAVPGVEEDYQVSGSWWSSIVALVLGALLPLMRPQRLIQSGISPKSVWERYIFIIATTAMLAGVPLALIGTLGQENISGYSYAANRPLLKDDIDNPLALCGLFDPDERALPAAIGKSTATQPQGNGGSVHQALKTALAAIPPQDALAIRDAVAVVEKRQETLTQMEGKFKNTTSYCDNWLEHYWMRTNQTLNFALGDPTNEAADYWTARKHSEAALAQLCDLIDTKLLPSSVLLAQLQKLAPPAQDQEGTSEKEGTRRAASDKYRKMMLDKLLVTSSLMPEAMPSHERQKANRLLLEEHYPTVFRKRSEVRRVVVVQKDQERRLLIFIVATAMFLGFGAWVDLNATSMHGYYRDRLAQAFIVPKSEKAPSIALSELKTTDYGGPYHLLSASAGWFRRQLAKPPLGGAETGRQRETSPGSPWVDSFLFSRRFCGSEATGYRDTKSFEGTVCGDLNRLDLAEAVALSGGAVSPGHVRNPFVAFLMFALNLRLGQWLPNPGGPRPVTRPSVLYLLWSLLRYTPESRPYCFVSDGGYSENLGLVQLLRRRCRLIIAVDSGQDPEHCFDDLARAIREARLHNGVEIVSLDGEGTTNGSLQVNGLRLRIEGEGSMEQRFCEQHFVLARLRYANGAEGLLVYVKPSMDGDEPIDLQQFRARHKDFPHQSTSDQLFDAEQVESYRQLGYHIGMKLLGPVAVESAAEKGELRPTYVGDLCTALQQAHGPRHDEMHVTFVPAGATVQIASETRAGPSGETGRGDNGPPTEPGSDDFRPPQPR